MADFVTSTIHVHPRFVHVAVWNNVAVTRSAGLTVQLAVASANARQFPNRAGRVERANTLNIKFTVDTGATHTLIPMELAKIMELQFSGKTHDVTVVGGTAVRCRRTTACLYLGQGWFDIQCVVPVEKHAGRFRPLLGMAGLLDLHLFCISKDELNLFRTSAKPTSGTQV